MLRLAVFVLVSLATTAIESAVALQAGATSSPPSLKRSAPKPPADVNNRPIIGILSIPNSVAGYTSQFRSYFPASYVKWIESGGARVVPIPFTNSAEEISTLAQTLNGFLFTGGGGDFFNANGTLTKFGSSAKILYDISMSSSKRGEWVPLWGTCLGFELILSLAAMKKDVLTGGFDSKNNSWPFYPTPAAANSLLFGEMPADAYEILKTQDVTLNSHQAGVTPDNFNNHAGVASNFDLLGIGYDAKGKAFVSATEAKTEPVFATQFHPEKPAFEWWSQKAVNHSTDSIYANGYFSRFFVAQTRKNTRHFANAKEEAAALIYNYSPVYSASFDPDFEQLYFFK